jgi:hypothetical protein
MTAAVIDFAEYVERRRNEALQEAVELGECEPGEDQCDRCWGYFQIEELHAAGWRIGRERYCADCLADEKREEAAADAATEVGRYNGPEHER